MLVASNSIRMYTANTTVDTPVRRLIEACTLSCHSKQNKQIYHGSGLTRISTSLFLSVSLCPTLIHTNHSTKVKESVDTTAVHKC
jgi:hypothetical protein